MVAQPRLLRDPAMKERRLPIHVVSPAYEDQGIFKMGLVSVSVWLLPEFARTGRGDVVIRGLFAASRDQNLRFDAIFAGRRRRFAEGLMRQLRPRAQNTEQADRVLPMQLNGAWRYRYDLDEQGWQTTQRQFMVAQYIETGPRGESVIVGEPVIRRGAVLAASG